MEKDKAMSNYKTFEDFIFIEVPQDAYDFRVYNSDYVSRVWYKRPIVRGMPIYDLPTGNWMTLAISDEVDENKAKKIVLWHHDGFEHYMNEEQFERSDFIYPKPSALESYKSLLVAAGIDYKRFLILKLIK